MNYRIEFSDDLMHVLDADNNGHDAFVVGRANEDAAKDKIDEWAAKYGIDPAPVKTELSFILA